MSNMDEISYWIYTKRAPCLYNVDSLNSKDEPNQAYPKTKSFPIITTDAHSPPTKKKRKLSIMDDESASIEKHANVYFDVPQIKMQPVKSDCKSNVLGSDIDFNVKKTSVQDKRKRTKYQKPGLTTLHKKNKLVTSTPNKQVTALRRSLRKTQNCFNNNSQLNSTFETFNFNVSFNDHSLSEKKREYERKLSDAMMDQTVPSKPQNEKARKVVANNHYEDLSDVSGFTANYIRSTKLHSNKSQRKLKNKTSNRNLMRESHSIPKEETRMIVCVNKSVNTGNHAPALNCSTDSSQNILNTITVKSNDRTRKINKSTSVLKFIDPKVTKVSNGNVTDALDSSKDTINDLDGRTSRYPKRHKNTIDTMDTEKINNNKVILDRRRKVKNSSHYNSHRKENPEEKISRTRSGRSIGLTIRQPENSVLVLNDSTDQVSSSAIINVASPQADQASDNRKRRKRVSARQMELKKSFDNCQTSRRVSLRDRSGFAACFSDSDDSEPLKQKKFFC